MERRMNQHADRTQAVIDDCLPLLRALAHGRYAITIGGSRGKRVADQRSDIDFRVFCDQIVGGNTYWQSAEWQIFNQAVDRWRAEGIEIDYCWVRTIDQIDQQLGEWLSGQIKPIEMTLWGYHLLTDLTNQVVIEDEHGLIATWQARLNPYPATLQQAIIKKHLNSLIYWRSDYHYRNKVARADLVFLAGMNARLVHDSMQVLFALNQTYYVGDGNNLHYAEGFQILPANFRQRVEAILTPGGLTIEQQYRDLLALIDDVIQLAEPIQPAST
jgi:hypothetical protein